MRTIFVKYFLLFILFITMSSSLNAITPSKSIGISSGLPDRNSDTVFFPEPYEYSLKKNQNDISNDSYYDPTELNTLKGFKCTIPDKYKDNPNLKIRLESLDVVTGDYYCSYSGGNEDYSVKLKHSNKNFFNASSGTKTKEADYFDKLYNDKIDTNEQFLNGSVKKLENLKIYAPGGNFPNYQKFYGTHTFPIVDGVAHSNAMGMNLGAVWDDLVKLSGDISKYNKENKDKGVTNTLKVDSHTRADQTLSVGLAGAITLDPQYYKKDLVTSGGMANFADIGILDTSTFDSSDSKDILEDFVSFLKSFIRFQEQTSIFTIFSFLDKYVWGFYIYFLENLREALSFIILSMVFIGGVYAGGEQITNRVKNYIFKSKNEEKKDLKSKFYDVFLVGLVFSMPVVFTGVNIPPSYLYQPSNSNQIGIPTKVEEQTALYKTATISQSAIRYFAEIGGYWGNTVSDYGFYSFLQYLRASSAFIDDKSTVETFEQFKELHKSSYYLQKKTAFFNNTCLALYADRLKGGNSTFSSNVNNYTMYDNSNRTGLFYKNNMNINEVPYSLCASLEQDIHYDTAKGIAMFSDVRERIKRTRIHLELDSNENATKKNSLDKYSSTMAFVQSNTGWANVTNVPTSFLFLQNINGLAVNDVEEKIKSDKPEHIQSQAGNNENKAERDTTDTIVGGVFNMASSMYVWNIMPGFSDAVKHLDEKLYSIFITKNPKEETPSTVFNEIQNKAKTAFKSLTKFVGKSLVLPSALTDSFKGALPHVKAAMIYVSALFIMIFIYKFTVATATLTVLSVIITVKTVLYYIELLIYFIVSDAIVFWSIITDKKEYLQKFLGKGLATLLVTPTLIVMSVYVYIFTLELMTSLFDYLITATAAALTIASSMIDSNQDELTIWSIFSPVSYLSKMLMIATFKAFGEMLIHIFGIVLAFVVIFKFKDWVLKMVGYSDDSISSSITQDIQQRLQRYSSPVN